MWENYPGPMRDMALFAVLRLALWAGLWWLLTLFDVGVLLAAALAALLAMLISILFFDRLRSSVALRWKAADERRRERKGAPVDEDAEAEDATLDAEDEAPEGAREGDVAADEGQDGPAAGPAELPDLAGEEGAGEEPARGAEDPVEDPATPGGDSRSRRD